MSRTVNTPISTGPINANYSKADTLTKIIKATAQQGIPGVSIAVYDANEGWWEATAGYAKIEDKTPMMPGHLHYLQSIAKTYTAVAILQLHEQGLINLDAFIADYLPQQYLDLVTGSGDITVRMLLNHTSGIWDFSSDPNYTADLIQNPLKKLTTFQILTYIKGKPSGFKPGSKFEYSNTNYELLALMIDKIIGNHAKYFDEHIFKPLGLTQTYYRNDAGYLNYPTLVNSYIDRFSDGSIENVSAWQTTNVANMIGDDGIVATPRDAVTFLRGIFEGKLLSPASLAEMMKWAKNGKGKETYGMGLYKLDFNGVEGFGHGGAGVGSGCELDYIPSKKVYVFLAANIGTIVDGPLVDKINDVKTRITNLLAK